MTADAKLVEALLAKATLHDTMAGKYRPKSMVAAEHVAEANIFRQAAAALAEANAARDAAESELDAKLVEAAVAWRHVVRVSNGDKFLTRWVDHGYELAFGEIESTEYAYPQSSVDALVRERDAYAQLLELARSQHRQAEELATNEHARAEAAESELAAVREATAPCMWVIDPIDESWDTACGNKHLFTTGDAADNLHAFCPYCGGRLFEPNYDAAIDAAAGGGE